jgi:hypothetical protein
VYRQVTADGFGCEDPPQVMGRGLPSTSFNLRGVAWRRLRPPTSASLIISDSPDAVDYQRLVYRGGHASPNHNGTESG